MKAYLTGFFVAFFAALGVLSVVFLLNMVDQKVQASIPVIIPTLETLYPPEGTLRVCKDFCTKELNKTTVKARVKLEKTYNGTAWACECEY